LKKLKTDNVQQTTTTTTNLKNKTEDFWTYIFDSLIYILNEIFEIELFLDYTLEKKDKTKTIKKQQRTK
jgi:hypothetical protein